MIDVQAMRLDRAISVLSNWARKQWPPSEESAGMLLILEELTLLRKKIGCYLKGASKGGHAAAAKMTKRQRHDRAVMGGVARAKKLEKK